MSDSENLRLDPEAASAVVDRVHGLADDMHTRGHGLVASMTASGSESGQNQAGAAATKLFGSLNDAVTERTQVLSSGLHDRASKAHQVIHRTTDQDEASAASISTVRPE